MRLTQENLDLYGALFAVSFDGRGIGIEPCESEGDIEMPLYEDLGGEWEPLHNQCYAYSPYESLEEILADCPELKKLDWRPFEEINFH